MKVVIDTNVIVSALMSINGTPAKILSVILDGKIKVLYDTRIIHEYIDVLSERKFGFNMEMINGMINYFKSNGEYINVEPLSLRFIDETDKKFYEVYKAGKAQYLVTGNLKHYPIEKGIIAPRKFLDQYHAKNS
jgi:putative PIN family toxin of toxin-antitoxin system